MVMAHQIDAIRNLPLHTGFFPKLGNMIRQNDGLQDFYSAGKETEKLARNDGMGPRWKYTS